MCTSEAKWVEMEDRVMVKGKIGYKVKDPNVNAGAFISSAPTTAAERQGPAGDTFAKREQTALTAKPWLTESTRSSDVVASAIFHQPPDS